MNDKFRITNRKRLILDPYQGHYTKPVMLNGRLNIEAPKPKPIKDHIAIRKNLQELMAQSQNQFFAKRHTKSGDRVFKSFNTTINNDEGYITSRNLDKYNLKGAVG